MRAVGLRVWPGGYTGGVPSSRDHRDAALRVTAAVMWRGGRAVLDHVDLSVAPGSIVGLAGANGAGKSSLLRAIGGRWRLHAGTVEIDGMDAAAARGAGRLGVVPQDLALHSYLTVRENLALWATLAGTPRRQVDARVVDGLHWAGLADRASTRVAALSGGMRRRVNLVAGVLHRPALVLLDEPTVGVDAESRARLYELLRDLRGHGTGVLIVTHDLQEAAELCDEVALIEAGAVLARGTVAALIAAWCGSTSEIVVVPVPGASVDRVLTAEGFVAAGDGAWSRSGGGSADELAEVERRLTAHALSLMELRVRRPTLAGAVATATARARVAAKATQ